MKISGILWLEDIVEKLIKKHKVNTEEVVETLSNKPRFLFVEKGYR